MKTIRFGRTEAHLPIIGVGTWPHGGPLIVDGSPVGWGGQDDPAATRAVLRAHALGLTHWDTADVYGNGHAEELIGGLWSDVPRAEIFLASKVGWDPGPHEHYYEPAHMRSQLERSLRLLRVEVIDLYYLHHCDFGPQNRYLDGAVDMVRRFREEGKIRFIGLSDWDNHKVARVADRVDPDAVQVYRSLLEDTYRRSGLEAWVNAHDVGVAFFSPLKHGLLLGKYPRPASFEPGDVRGRIDGFRDQDLLDALAANRDALRSRLRGVPEPVLSGLVAPLLADCPTGCALLGLRSSTQVDAAARITVDRSPVDLEWLRRRYRGLVAAAEPEKAT